MAETGGLGDFPLLVLGQAENVPPIDRGGGALAGKLREEEQALVQLRAKRSSEQKERAPRAVPSATRIAGYLDNLLGVLQTDTVRGRELLSRFVSPIIMTPETENPVRRYRATGAFNLSFLLTAAASGESGSGKSSCAGRI